MRKKSEDARLYDVFILWIAAVSLAAVSLLTFNHYKSLHALTVGTMVTVCCVATCYQVDIRGLFDKKNFCILAILSVALIFRAEPYLWVMGGQDQGLYVNMSAQYEKYGSPFVQDRVRDSLSDQAKAAYDRTQHYLDSFQGYNSYPTVDIEAMKKKGEFNLNVKHSNPYAMHTSAVVMKDMSRSEYVFQFYPLHPLWMAIFAKFFGDDNRVYSQVIFSLLSIVSLYLLALELSGGQRTAGILVASMLALNPLHTFFSKFPVTEIPTLFFSATAFYYLARYYNRSLQSIYRIDYLFISASLFLCMFCTRISGFLYMPVFYFILITVILREREDKKRASHLICYSLAVMALYALSVMAGLLNSYPYSMNVYTGIFSWFFGQNWPFMIAGVILFSLAGAGILHLMRNNAGAINCLNYRNIVQFIRWMLSLAVVFALIRAVMKIQGQDMSQVFSFTLAATVAYISPVAFLFLYTAVKENNCANRSFHLVLLAFFAWFFASTIVLSPVIPYQFYYARYLLSEIVPYGLLLVALYWASLWIEGNWTKKLVAGAFGLTCLYFLFFSSFQLQGAEADGAAQALQKVRNNVKESELLFLGFDDLRLQTALSYYYDINTYRADRPQTVNDTIYPELKSKFSKLYLLTKSPVNNQSMKLVSEVPYREGEYEHVNRIPTKFRYIYQCTLYLYEIDKKLDTPSVSATFINNKIWTNAL